MVTYFVGALGTFLGGFAWTLWQWDGVCALGASFFGAALIVWAVGSWESEDGVPRAGTVSDHASQQCEHRAFQQHTGRAASPG